MVQVNQSIWKNPYTNYSDQNSLPHLSMQKKKKKFHTLCLSDQSESLLSLVILNSKHFKHVKKKKKNFQSSFVETQH